MPKVQRERFMEQAKQVTLRICNYLLIVYNILVDHVQGQDGDDEAQAHDEDFCVALEYGLPPTVCVLDISVISLEQSYKYHSFRLAGGWVSTD